MDAFSIQWSTGLCLIDKQNTFIYIIEEVVENASKRKGKNIAQPWTFSLFVQLFSVKNAREIYTYLFECCKTHWSSQSLPLMSEKKAIKLQFQTTIIKFMLYKEKKKETEKKTTEPQSSRTCPKDTRKISINDCSSCANPSRHLVAWVTKPSCSVAWPKTRWSPWEEVDRQISSKDRSVKEETK